MITNIQSRLMDVGAAVATPTQTSSDIKKQRTRFDGTHVQKLEAWIDHMDAQLPPLTNFILPSGGLCAGHLHVARTICRRAERRVIPLIHAGDVEEEVGKYVNRYSRRKTSWG